MRFFERLSRDYAPFGFFQKSALFWCTLISLQCVLQHPIFEIIPGERTNLFTTFICFAGLFSVACAVRKGQVRATTTELALSFLLPIILLASARFSPLPGPATWRALSIIGPGLGGFWLARIIFDDPRMTRWLVTICAILLAIFLCVHSAGYFLTGNVLQPNPGMHYHAFANMITLLWFAPLAFIETGTRKWLGFALLLASYIIIFLSGSRFGVVMPAFLVGAALVAGRLPWKAFVAAAIAIAVLLTGYLMLNPDKMPRLHNYESLYYRAESYPFTLHILKKHPLTGVGLRSPRMDMAEDYVTKFPYANREDFLGTLQRNVTFDNMYLTFFADTGIPFSVLYIGAILVIFWRLLKQVRRRSGPSGFPVLALYLALSATFVQMLFHEAIMYPQVCWFFHLFLGLVPPAQKA